MKTQNNKGRFAVYRNLNNGQLSIKSLDTSLVIGHCQRVVLSDVVFKANKKGVQRIREKQRKEVVAMVTGIIIDLDGFVSYKNRGHGPYLIVTPLELSEKIYFDPYKWFGFVDKNHNEVIEKRYIEIKKNGEMLASLR